MPVPAVVASVRLSAHQPVTEAAAARRRPSTIRRTRGIRSPSDGPEVWRRLTAQSRDRDLAARLVAGDESALREAYREHAPAVYGLARRILGDDTLADDITQDVFVRLWEHPD